MDNLIQGIILVLSGVVIWLVTKKSRKKRKIGACIGVFAQLFWIMETYNNNQWGMLILSGWYLLVFLRILVRCK